MNVKNQELDQNKMYLRILKQYENLNYATYHDGDRSKLVVAQAAEDESNMGEMQQLSQTVNPYLNLFFWVKAQIADIKSLSSAMEFRDGIIGKLQRRAKKQESRKEDLDNVTMGRKTLKTLLKKPEDSAKMASRIEEVGEEMESLREINEILTIYLGETVVPGFQARQLKMYQKIIK